MKLVKLEIPTTCTLIQQTPLVMLDLVKEAIWVRILENWNYVTEILLKTMSRFQLGLVFSAQVEPIPFI